MVYVGQIALFAFPFAPENWLPCDGRMLSISAYPQLYGVIRTTYGGDGQTTFALPDLRGRVPIGMGQGNNLSFYTLGQQVGSEGVELDETTIPQHTHDMLCSSAPASTNVPSNRMALANEVSDNSLCVYSDSPTFTTMLSSKAITQSEGGAAHENRQPFMGINYCIAWAPSSSLIGQIALFPFATAPAHWALCQGQVLSVNRYTALFNLLGTQYGGDGITTFGLPDLRGRVPVGVGHLPNGAIYDLGAFGGVETVGLTSSQNAAHTHRMLAFDNDQPADSTQPMGNYLGRAYQGNFQAFTASYMYSANAPNATLLPNLLPPQFGLGNPHDNIQPYVALNYAISLEDGGFPIRPPA